MPELNSDQFKVFSQMDEMDKKYPTPYENRSGSYFHGTTHNITDGMVRPADDVDKEPSEYSMGDPGDLSEGDHAFVVRNNENYAWHAALTFHKNGRRPRVYETGPSPDMKPGPWNKEHPDFLYHHGLEDPQDYPHVGPDSDDYPTSLSMKEDAEEARANHQDEWASPTGFPVRKRIDIMPGRQGTFPTENWNKYKNGSPRYGIDANHPHDMQIQYGNDSDHEQTHHAALAEHKTLVNENQFGHDWHRDPPPHSELRELAGRPQKRWATLFDQD
jgi:hypothetical protein